MESSYKKSESSFDRLLVVPPTMDIPDDVRSFYDQPLEDQRYQMMVISEMYRPAVDAMFADTRGLGWIVVGVPTGEIIKTGKLAEEEPSLISQVEILADQAITRCLPAVFLVPIFDHPGRN